MNILATINNKYVPYLISMLRSLIYYNHNQDINLFIISQDVTEDILAKYQTFVNGIKIKIIIFDDSLLIDAPTSKRYPKTIYYRLFAYKVLPANLERILYLDPDIIINGDLTDLYNMDFAGNALIGATTIKEPLRKFNEIKNKAPKGAPYLNTGVLLMNLDYLRANTNDELIYNYIADRHRYFTLPDQDIISALYGEHIKLVPADIYNLSDRGIKFHNLYNEKNKIDFTWVLNNTKIIHFYGRNKPWLDDYHGILKPFYDKFKIQ